MSAPTTPATAPSRRGGKVLKTVAAVAAIAALAFGASRISESVSSPATNASSPQTTQAAAPQGGMTPPGMGTAVTGSTLDKLEQVATAKYPGTVERAMQLDDGSYVVHVMRSSGGEVHVLVSKDLKVTGVEQGGPPAGAAPPSGQTAPDGSAPSTPTQAS